MNEGEIKVGDWVVKTTGDYSFEGLVVSVFSKLKNGPERIVVENSDRILHIFSPKQLTRQDSDGMS